MSRVLAPSSETRATKASTRVYSRSDAHGLALSTEKTRGAGDRPTRALAAESIVAPPVRGRAPLDPLVSFFTRSSRIRLCTSTSKRATPAKAGTQHQQEPAWDSNR